MINKLRAIWRIIFAETYLIVTPKWLTVTYQKKNNMSLISAVARILEEQQESKEVKE